MVGPMACHVAWSCSGPVAGPQWLVPYDGGPVASLMLGLVAGHVA